MSRPIFISLVRPVNGCGVMLHSQAGQVLTGEIESIRLPGATWQDYRAPVLVGEGLALAVWMIMPVFAISRGQWIETSAAINPPAFTIRFLIGWTALAAVFLVCLQLLNSEGSPIPRFYRLTMQELCYSYTLHYIPATPSI